MFFEETYSKIPHVNHAHTIDKRLVRNSFGRAAVSYDKAAILQREVCDRALLRLDHMQYTSGVILDIGSGTGYGTRKLLVRHPGANLLAMDIAPAMHVQARSAVSWGKRLVETSQNSNHSQIGYIGGDVEQMPLKDSSVELVWSNLMLQWCNDIKQAFSEIYRILQSNGVLVFSTFGPDTLRELRRAFLGADGYSHVNRFTDMHDISDMLAKNGFGSIVMDVEYIVVPYDDVISMMRDLKAIGAHNVTRGRRRSLTGKTAWQKAMNYYETLREGGKLPATFEVIYGRAWKPRLQKNGPPNWSKGETSRDLVKEFS